MYNCSTLDAIVANIDKLVVRAFLDGKLEKVYELNPKDAADKCAGIFTRKFFGERLIVRKRYDYCLGSWLIEFVGYGNGYIERFEFIY